MAIQKFSDYKKQQEENNQKNTIQKFSDYAKENNITYKVNNISNSNNKVGATLGNLGLLLGKGAAKSSEGILDFLNDLTEKTTAKAFEIIGRDDLAEQERKSRQNFIQRDLTSELGEKTGASEQITKNEQSGSLLTRDNLGGQVVQAIGGQIPTLAIGALTGVGGLNNAINTSNMRTLAKVGTTALINAPTTATLATRSYGGALEEAYLNGATEAEATKYAIGTTASEIATEWITGGIPGTNGKGGLDALADKGIDKISNQLVKDLTKYGYKMVGEGVEEGLAEIISPILKNATYSNNEQVDWNNVINSAIIGGITGGILETPNMVKNVVTDVKQTKNNIKLPTVNNIVNPEQTENNNSNQVQLPTVNYLTKDNVNNNEIANQFNKKIENALTNKKSNGKTILGKVNNYVVEKVKTIFGIDITNKRHTISDYDIRHMINEHGNPEVEAQKGQIAITKEDIKNIPDIISNPTDIVKGTKHKMGETIRYIKRYNDNTTYVVEVIPDNSNSLIIKTMWKKPSTLTNSNAPSSTSETQGSDISSTTATNIPQTDNNVKSALLPIINNMQTNENNTTNMPVIENKKIMNPLEISKLTTEDANTTPILKKINVSTVDGESKFASNIRNKTDMLTESSKDTILSSEDVRFYEKVTNQESLEKAFERLKNNGKSETESWLRKKSENATNIDVAEGWILLKQYQDRISVETDINTKNELNRSMVEVAKKLREIGTKAGQTVQAFNILNRLTPEGMVYYAQSELSEAYEKMSKNKTKEWIESNREKFELTPKETQFIMDTMQEVQQMEDGYEKRVKLAEIQKLMTDKLPPERGAGIKSWMRISMLFNPKTQVRNVMGNAVIAPVNSFSDLFASMVDKQIAKKTGIRTTGKTNLSKYKEGFKTGLYQSYNDFKKGINTRNMQGNRFEVTQGKSFNDNNAIGKQLNKVDSLLSFMLDAGDRGFYEASFTNSINNQMILNNTTEVTQDMIDIATSEALSRTWQDNNNYTKFVLQTRNALNKINIKGYGLGDILIPFAKTPANLTKAIIDYSPLGMINAINSGINLKNSLSNGQYNAKMQHQFVQNLGKATAGTMLYILGYALAEAGITSGESDEDKDVKDFMKNTLGVSSYSIKIGNKTFTYDWAQPIAAPLSIMANIVNKQKEGATLTENIISSLDTAGNILLEQSFMESINTVLNNQDGIVTGIQEAILELPSRAIPTLMKQIVDLTDDTQRTTFEYDKPLQTAVNKVKAKLPGLSTTLSPVVDTMGREVKRYGGKNNIFNVFLNPANVNTENTSESAQEIYRVYKSTGDKTVMPRVVPYYFDEKGVKRTLTSKERSKFQKISGTIIEENVDNLLNNSNYVNMNDTDKSAVLNNLVNYAYNKARYEMFGTEMSNEYNKVNEWTEQGGSVSGYYANKEECDYSLENPKKYKTMTSLNLSYEDYTKYSKEINNIKTKYNDTNSRKNAVWQYIQNEKLTKVQKILLYNLCGGYSISNYKEYMFNYINNQNITKAEKQEIWNYLYE